MKEPDPFAVRTDLPLSACLECGYQADMASGPNKPTPGDAALCFGCGSLNVFDDQLRFRAPTDDELFMAARDPHIQKLRRAIMAVKNEGNRK